MLQKEAIALSTDIIRNLAELRIQLHAAIDSEDTEEESRINRKLTSDREILRVIPQILNACKDQGDTGIDLKKVKVLDGMPS